MAIFNLNEDSNEPSKRADLRNRLIAPSQHKARIGEKARVRTEIKDRIRKMVLRYPRFVQGVYFRDFSIVGKRKEREKERTHARFFFFFFNFSNLISSLEIGERREGLPTISRRVFPFSFSLFRRHVASSFHSPFPNIFP